jgi:HEAT repeats
MVDEAFVGFGAAGKVRAIRRRPESEALPALVALLGALARPAQERAAAAVRLGRMAPGRADAALLAALRDPEPQVVRRAAEALGRVGGPEAGAALTRTRPPADPAGARSLAFARLLHAARHDLDGPALPKGGPRATFDPRGAASLEPSPLSPAQREALAGVLHEELPAIPVAPEGAVALACGTNRFLVLPHARAAGLAGRGVAAVVLKRAQSLDRYALFLYILAERNGDGLALAAFRADGSRVGVGEAWPGRRPRFTLEALQTLLLPPVRLEGTLEDGILRFETAMVSTSASDRVAVRRPVAG